MYRVRLVLAAALLGGLELNLVPAQVADHLGALVLGVSRKLGEACPDELAGLLGACRVDLRHGDSRIGEDDDLVLVDLQVATGDREELPIRGAIAEAQTDLARGERRDDRRVQRQDADLALGVVDATTICTSLV